MSDAWDDWEAADEAGAFDNVNDKTTSAELRHALDVKQFQKSSGPGTGLDFRPGAVAAEFETQQTAAFQVRILKRPDKKTNGPEKSASSAVTNSAPGAATTKSLQQREADYLKARERIFGSGPPSKAASPSLSPSTSSAASPRIVREPRGPDGTRGFTSRTG